MHLQQAQHEGAHRPVGLPRKHLSLGVEQHAIARFVHEIVRRVVHWYRLGGGCLRAARFCRGHGLAHRAFTLYGMCLNTALACASRAAPRRASPLLCGRIVAAISQWIAAATMMLMPRHMAATTMASDLFCF